MNTKLDKLGQPSLSSSLRLLVLLDKLNKPTNQSVLVMEMKKTYDVGRCAVENAIKACAELELIAIKKERIGINPMPSFFHTLTPKGHTVAIAAKNLEEAVEL